MYVDVILFVMCEENHTILMFPSISHSLCLVPVLSVVCWRAHVLFTLIVCVCVLFTLIVCVCVHSGVQHTLRCVLALFYFVLCTLSCQII